MAAPADAATRQNGLVNVALTDTTVQVPIAVAANVSATDTVVQIPVGIAANVCGVAVSVLAGPNIQFPVTCTAKGVSIANA
ncbi:MAG: hypothetical protein ABJA93_07875 [Sporichthyaceae bacterium]